MMQPQKPSPPNASIDISPSQITISGAPLPGSVAPAAVLRGFRAERQELANQLSDLQDTRSSLMRDLQQLPPGEAGRAEPQYREAARLDPGDPTPYLVDARELEFRDEPPRRLIEKQTRQSR